MEPKKSNDAIDAAIRSRSSRRDVLRRAAALGVAAPALGAIGATRRPGLTRAQDAPGAYTPQGPKVDRLVMWTRSTPDAPDNTEFANLTAVAQAYTAAVGTPVEIVTVPDADFKAKMGISAPGGGGPDLFGPIAHDWLGEFAIQNITLEIPKDRIPAVDDVNTLGIQACSVDGVLTAMPLFIESVAFIYNKDLVPTPPTTWEELVTMATELTTGDVYGFGFPLLDQYYESSFLYGMGGYVFQYENGDNNIEDIGLNNPAAVETYKFLRDIYHQQQPPMPEAAIDRVNMHKVQEGMMEQRQLAMTISGPWREAPLTKAGINYGVSVLPTLPNGQPMRPFVGVQAFAVNAYNENSEAALDFVLYATSTPSVLELYKGFVKTPVRTTALQDPSVMANPNIATWNQQAAAGVPMPNIAAMTNVWTPWQDAVDAIIPNNAPDDQIQPALDGAVEAIQAAIEESQG